MNGGTLYSMADRQTDRQDNCAAFFYTLTNIINNEGFRRNS